MNWNPVEQNSYRGLIGMFQRLKEAVVRRPLRAFKAVGRWFERRLARRISERYADEIEQFAALNHAIQELQKSLTARLERQEAYQWDHAALARRLAALEDHVNGLLDLAALDEDELERNVVRLPLTETLAATTAVGQLRRAG
ncbi:MAG TPA: hypothetical protein VFI31_06625 [Pirellulales bacterium]|nr:hypothetical protein [Pirellulales bacterium]